MRLVKLIMMIAVLLLLLILSIAAPMALIGVAIYIIGILLYTKTKNGKRYAAGKPSMFLTVGAISSIVLVLIFAEPAPEENNADLKSEQQAKKDAEKMKNEQIEKEKEEEAAKELAAKQAKEEAEDKAKLEAAAKENAEAEAKEKVAAAEEADFIARLGLEAATVSRVVDGDTLETSDGRKIRFIGVNTPESTTRKETFGKEASYYTKSKLDGKEIWLQKDVSETDRYGRQLRFIWLAIPTDDMNESEIRAKLFNADLVLNGYAEPSTFPPDVKYSDYFAKFAREARETGTGLWAFGTEGTTKGDLDKAAAAKKTATTSKPAATTTQPAANTAESASSSEPEYFANCTELRTVYPDGVPSTHAAYQSKMDRDKDNFACER